jgi:hypothetical protein
MRCDRLSGADFAGVVGFHSGITLQMSVFSRSRFQRCCLVDDGKQMESHVEVPMN